MRKRPDAGAADSEAGASTALQDFGVGWIAEFRKTNAFEVWERVTDPTLFDIVEPKCVFYHASPR